MLKFVVEIEGSNWKDVQDLELFDVPHEGDTIETRYGTCVVTAVDVESPGGKRHGTIVCRLP